MIPIPGKVLKVGRWALGKYGRKETAKQAAGNGATAVVAAFLAGKAGLGLEVSAAVAALVVTVGNAAWEYMREYKVAVDDEV
jgi:uncharacterized membrane protein YjjB (DUF3815 family)